MEQYLLAYVASKALTAFPVQVTTGFCAGTCCLFVVMVKHMPQLCVDRGALILRALTIVQSKEDMRLAFREKAYRISLADDLVFVLDRSLESLRTSELQVTMRCLSLYDVGCPYRALLSYE